MEEEIPQQPIFQPDENQITFFAQANFRNSPHRFGIKRGDRRRHMYVIGKTGMGKSTMLENMIIQDIQNGEGVAVVDPHGDLVEKVIDFVPPHRINDVVYINPADLDHPVAFNILENVGLEYRNLVSNGLVGVFKKIWADSWGPRLEYILINTILALLEYPGSTLLGVMRMLVDTKYRRKVVRKITDPVVRSFWVNEFNNYSEKFRNEAIAPIQNKIGQFLSSALIRNIVGQVKSTINMRQLMDEGKIIMLNLSKGRIGEENSALLGAMIITKIQLAAMSRVDIPEHTRRDFYLYVDEFQNFSTDSFAGILSEARKYRLNITMAHQYIEQLSDEVRAAVFGNVGTLAAFRVGATDAEELEKEFMPTFTQEDIVMLPAYHIYLRLMIDGVASSPFSATTLSPISEPTGNGEKVIRVSRERYANDRQAVEEEILRWTGDEDNMPPAVKKMDQEKEQAEEKIIPTEKPVRPIVHTPVPAPPSVQATAPLQPPVPPRAPSVAEQTPSQDDLQDFRRKGLSFIEKAKQEETTTPANPQKKPLREPEKRKDAKFVRNDSRSTVRTQDRKQDRTHTPKKIDAQAPSSSNSSTPQASGETRQHSQESRHRHDNRTTDQSTHVRADRDNQDVQQRRRRKRKRSSNSGNARTENTPRTAPTQSSTQSTTPKQQPLSEQKSIPKIPPSEDSAKKAHHIQPGQTVRFDS